MQERLVLGDDAVAGLRDDLRPVCRATQKRCQLIHQLGRHLIQAPAQLGFLHCRLWGNGDYPRRSRRGGSHHPLLRHSGEP